ncbi:MAG: hypothetical protein ABIG64_00665 [Candidatus Omnitrophota bacterium]
MAAKLNCKKGYNCKDGYLEFKNCNGIERCPVCDVSSCNQCTAEEFPK